MADRPPTNYVQAQSGLPSGNNSLFVTSPSPPPSFSPLPSIQPRFILPQPLPVIIPGQVHSSALDSTMEGHSRRQPFHPTSSTVIHSPLDILGATATTELRNTSLHPKRPRNSVFEDPTSSYIYPSIQSDLPTDSQGNVFALPGSNDGNERPGLGGSSRHEILNLAKTDATRVRIQGLVEHELRMRYPFREDWQKKCKDMAAQLEEVIYRNAKTVGEYKDETTLSLRLVEIFMAKKKKDLSKDKEDGEEVYNSILDKARTRWLTGEEIVVLLMKCSRKLPRLLMMNDSAFVPVSGSLFHFGSAVLGDGYNWLKAASTNLLQEHRFILTVGGQPRVWVSLNVDIQKKMHRRTYWLAENTAIGVLVHYLSENLAPVPHTKSCFCLSCLFEKACTENSASGTSMDTTEHNSKRSRND